MPTLDTGGCAECQPVCKRLWELVMEKVVVRQPWHCLEACCNFSIPAHLS